MSFIAVTNLTWKSVFLACPPVFFRTKPHIQLTRPWLSLILFQKFSFLIIRKEVEISKENITSRPDFYTTFYLTCIVRPKNFYRIDLKICPQGQFFAQITNLTLFFRFGTGIKANRAIEISLKLALFFELSSHISVYMESTETGSKAFLQRIIY